MKDGLSSAKQEVIMGTAEVRNNTGKAATQDQEATSQEPFNIQEAANWVLEDHCRKIMLLFNLADQTKTPEAIAVWSLLHFHLPNVEQVHLTLEQHGFQLCGSNCTLIFFSINTINIINIFLFLMIF